MWCKYKRMILVFAIMYLSMMVGCGAVSENLVKDYDGYYKVVKNGLYNYESEIVVDVKNYDESVFNGDVINDILEDNLELSGNFENTKVSIMDLKLFVRVILEPEYHESKEALVNKDNEINKKVEEILSVVIKPEMKDYEKERALHDYLSNNCKYDQRLFTEDMPNQSYTAYGALIDGIAVCQGYTVAMDKLLKAVDIETMTIIGEALNGDEYISHSWNLVKLGEDYYHLDTTWDDPITDDGSDKLRYSYFNITDEQIKDTHKWNESNYPKATKTEYSFDNLNLLEVDLNGNNIVVVKDRNDFNNNIKEDLLNDIRDKTYKIINFDGGEMEIEDSIQQAFTIGTNIEECQYTIEIDEVTKARYVSLSFN
ncbi:transglutaminase domain-containing protein [Clostridium sp.]|uniref:transglutaminase domain-containing protein n=1 Tax=Clostridium sp. TaxID=1506 RepID=UPI0026327F91|nr:transglutaminase domain-containing protein [Clostridium sp.]